MRIPFPTGTNQSCVLVPIDAALIPLVSGALKIYEQRATWSTDADYEAGYNAFAQLQADLVNNCLQNLVEGQERLYRLLDTALNGTAYSVTTPATASSPAEISPAIPDVPPSSTTDAGSMRAQLARLLQLAENAATGQVYPAGAIDGLAALGYDGSWRARLETVAGILPSGWPLGIGDRPATVADLVTAVRASKPADIERVTSVLDVLNGAGSTAGIFSAVRDLLTDTAELGAEGGILAVLIASTMASAATAGLQAAQLDQVVSKLDRVIEQIGVGQAPLAAETVAGRLETIGAELAP